jgi:ribosomal protein L11 methyltransferase
VLDIGTGTGVLSLVASSLGAGWVVGFDRDPEAPLLASQNAVLNGVRVPFFVGTVDALADDSSFELVLVNVLPENLAGQEETIAGRVAPGGVLLLSGVLAERSAEISDRWRAFGLELRRVRSCGDWVMLALERPLAGVEARRRSAARGAQW